jgi:hypothetical protein
MTREHSNGFRHLDLPLEGLDREYDLGWKFDPNTDGPPGWTAEPYQLLYVSYRQTTGEVRKSGTLRYALSRSRWREQPLVSEEDRRHLLELAKVRIPQDLQALEQGAKRDHLDQEHRLYL